jgi:hypothetical protein
MNCWLRCLGFCTAAALVCASAAGASVAVPTVENFSTGIANWRDVGSVDLTYQPAGGPDGSGYVTTSYPLDAVPSTGVILFRGQDGFNSSSDAFVGDWLTPGVGTLTAYVRHNGPEALPIFARIAKAANNPGVDIELPFEVQPNVWTKLTFDLHSTNPLLTVEGPPSFYSQVFSAVGNVQIGLGTPAIAASATVVFDLDQVAIHVPEPGTLVLALVALFGVWPYRRMRG